MQVVTANEFVDEHGNVWEDEEDYFVNSKQYNVDYSDEVKTREDDENKQEMLHDRVESLCNYDTSRDVGAVMIYYRDGKICGFFDYERFVGRYR